MGEHWYSWRARCSRHAKHQASRQPTIGVSRLIDKQKDLAAIIMIVHSFVRSFVRWFVRH